MTKEELLNQFNQQLDEYRNTLSEWISLSYDWETGENAEQMIQTEISYLHGCVEGFQRSLKMIQFGMAHPEYYTDDDEEEAEE